MLCSIAVPGVGDEHREDAVDGFGFAPALRVIGVGRGVAPARRRSEPVLSVKGIRERTVAGGLS
jgi:hypothetical protein